MVNDFMLQMNNLADVLWHHVPPILTICVPINTCEAWVELLLYHLECKHLKNFVGVKYNIHQKLFVYVAAYLTAMFLIRPWLLVEGTFSQMKKEFLNKEIIE